MIDDPEKTRSLLARLDAALPIRASATADIRKIVQKHSPEIAAPDRCEIARVDYAGDEGGIVCHLDFGAPDNGQVYVASITHVDVDRRNPLFPEIAAYRKHRIKRLRKLGGRPG